MQFDGQSGAADLLQQRVEAIQAGLGHEIDLVSIPAHGAEEAPHLGKRCAPRPLDASERVAVLGQRIGELVPDGAHLEHHHADRVSDDVVELARDPRALLCHRDACGSLALALGPGGTLFCRFGLLGTLTQRIARDPGDHEPEGDEDEVADWRGPGML